MIRCGKSVRQNNQSAIRIARQRRDNALDCSVVMNSSRDRLHLELSSSGLQRTYVIWSVRSRLRVEHNSNLRDVWRDFLEQPQPFPTYRGFKICKPSNIGARTRQVRDKLAADWVRDGGEYDGNGTRLGLKRRSCRSGTSKDDIGLHCHEFFCKCTDATGISSRPAIVKPDVAFSRPSQLLKAVSDCLGVGLSFRIVFSVHHQYPDVSHPLRLLRARRERPRDRAAEQRDELAPLHVRSQAQKTALYRLKRLL